MLALPTDLRLPLDDAARGVDPAPAPRPGPDRAERRRRRTGGAASPVRVVVVGYGLNRVSWETPGALDADRPA